MEQDLEELLIFQPSSPADNVLKMSEGHSSSEQNSVTRLSSHVIKLQKTLEVT